MNFDPEGLEPFLESLEMLGRQNFSRGHERNMVRAFQRHQGTAGSDHGFAGADVALQQTAQRMGTSQGVTEFAQNAGLRGREREAKLFEKGPDQMVVTRAGQTARASFEAVTADFDVRLQIKKFVERQSAASSLDVVDAFGEMEAANGVGAGGERWRARLHRAGFPLEIRGSRRKKTLM